MTPGPTVLVANEAAGSGPAPGSGAGMSGHRNTSRRDDCALLRAEGGWDWHLSLFLSLSVTPSLPLSFSLSLSRPPFLLCLTLPPHSIFVSLPPLLSAPGK